MSQHHHVFTIDKAFLRPRRRRASRRPAESSPSGRRAATPRLTERAPTAGRASGRSARCCSSAPAFSPSRAPLDLGWRYWTVGRFEVSTDDAYVKADSTTIAPKISGYIAAVPVGDNEPVKAGQVLARIDDRDFKVALEQAKADVEAARPASPTSRRRSPPSSPPSTRPRPPSSSTRPTQTFAEQDDKRYADARHQGLTAASRTPSRPPPRSPRPAPPWRATPRRSRTQPSSSTC